MDDEGTTSCVVDALRIFCVSFVKDTSRKLYIERPALHSKLPGLLESGEAISTDFEDCGDPGELWYAIVDTFSRGTALFDTDDVGRIGIKCKLIPSHMLRAVGSFCVTVELCLEYHPHLHTAMTESISLALMGGNECPGVLLRLMQSYREHITTTNHFIKRVGGTPRCPDSSWERWEAEAAAGSQDLGGIEEDEEVDDMEESLQVSVLSAGARPRYVDDSLDLTASDEGLAGLLLGNHVDQAEPSGPESDAPEPRLIALNSGFERGDDEDEDSDGDDERERSRQSPARQRSPTRMKVKLKNKDSTSLRSGTKGGASSRLDTSDQASRVDLDRSLRASLDESQDSARDDDSQSSLKRYLKGGSPEGRRPVADGTPLSVSRPGSGSGLLSAPPPPAPAEERIAISALRACFIRVAGTTGRSADRMDLSRALRTAGVPFLADDVLALELSTVSWHTLLDHAASIVVAVVPSPAEGGGEGDLVASPLVADQTHTGVGWKQASTKSECAESSSDKGTADISSLMGATSTTTAAPTSASPPSSSAYARAGVGNTLRFNMSALGDAVRDLRRAPSSESLTLDSPTSVGGGGSGSGSGSGEGLNLGSPLASAGRKTSTSRGAADSPGRSSPGGRGTHAGTSPPSSSSSSSSSWPEERKVSGMRVNIVRRDGALITSSPPRVEKSSEQQEQRQEQEQNGTEASGSERVASTHDKGHHRNLWDSDSDREGEPRRQGRARPPAPKVRSYRGRGPADQDRARDSARAQRRGRGTEGVDAPGERPCDHGEEAQEQEAAAMAAQEVQTRPNPGNFLENFVAPERSVLADRSGIIFQGYLEKKGSGILGRWIRRYFVLMECTTGQDLAMLCQYDKCIKSAWGEIPLLLKSVLYVSDIEEIERSSKNKYEGMRFDIIVSAITTDAYSSAAGSDAGSQGGSDSGSVYSDGSNSGNKYSGKRIICRADNAESCLMWFTMLQRTRAAVSESLRVLATE